jgi:two-component system osmolarity sensor histidine kinase EnvZ
MAENDAIRLKPWQPIDQATPIEPTDYWNKVSSLVNAQLKKTTPLFWALNGEPGLWVGFRADQIQYWLALEREHINDTFDTEWVSWVIATILLSLIGAAIAVSYLNRPLNRLARNVKIISRGLTPEPLPEKGVREIRELNRSFNRMAAELQEAEADRNLMLAGISHDLRTPLSRMRLEVEMSPMSQTQQNAIDQDLAQVECTLDQLLNYARPANKPPGKAINVSEVVMLAVNTSQPHALEYQCTITLGPIAHASALIDPHDLKRCLTNLIENAKRYGHHKRQTPHEGAQLKLGAQIEVSVHTKDDRVMIDINDDGPGIRSQDIARVLRPFSRGISARTGGGGAGLGLAIVNRLITSAGGTLELLPSQQGGLLARLNLPLVD